jgi:LPPG:FO 2-phospho-L-lactate transferase
VRDGSPDDVAGVDLSAARRAKPGPGVLESLRGASVIVLCPSNPVVSIGPILAVPGIREALRASGAPVVAISPIVEGRGQGPADRCCADRHRGSSAAAELYREVAQVTARSATPRSSPICARSACAPALPIRSCATTHMPPTRLAGSA